jgi:hypothetical protein
MKYETAVRRLRTIAERCEQMTVRWSGEFMVAAYAFGSVLDSRDDIAVVEVAFVLDAPPDELTWGVRPQKYIGLPHWLDFDTAPVGWYLRPAVWPVHNHMIVRPLRIWSHDGPDTVALDALEHGQAEPLRLPPPSDDDLREQLAEELTASLTHLRRVEADYWERQWRRENRGAGIYPENHLWDAVYGYLDLLDGTRRLT